MGGCLGSPGLHFSQPLEAAVPKSATFSTATSVLTVTFNHRLIAGPSAAANWDYFDGTNIWNPAGPITIGMWTVSGVVVMGGLDATAASCAYGAAPADVVDRNALPVAAFAGFPVTVIP